MTWSGTTAAPLAAFPGAARIAGFATTAAMANSPDRALIHAELEAFARERLPRDTPFVLLGEWFSDPVAIAITADPPPNLQRKIVDAGGIDPIVSVYGVGYKIEWQGGV